MSPSPRRRLLPELDVLRALDANERWRKITRFVLAPDLPGRSAQRAGALWRSVRPRRQRRTNRLPVCRSYTEAIEHNYAEATALLDAAGITYRDVATRDSTRTDIAIAYDERERLLDAFAARAAAGATIGLHVTDEHDGVVRHRHLPFVTPWSRRRALDTPAWYFFRRYSISGSPRTLGVRHACRITAESARRPEADEHVMDRDGNGASGTVDTAGAPPAHRVTFPIDLVYLWVDGTDPQWQARRDETWHSLHPDAPAGAGLAPHLYRNRDELRYSLRSVEMFAPFVRHVFIVTDDQVPAWLDTSNPRVTVVSHRDLFERDDLPTFNSNAIDTRLHHIDGLSEHFLVTNDDIFFAGPTFASDFFEANGTPYLFLSRAQVPLGDADPRDIAVDAAAKNNRRLLLSTFGRRVTRKFKHIPIPQVRAARTEVERVFPAEVRATTSHRFRHCDDVSFSHLSAYYAYFAGRGAASTVPYEYVNLSDWRLVQRLEALVDLAQGIKVFCLNDADTFDVTDPYGEVTTTLTVDEATRDARVADFLATLFPTPSEFERAPATAGTGPSLATPR